MSHAIPEAMQRDLSAIGGGTLLPEAVQRMADVSLRHGYDLPAVSRNFTSAALEYFTSLASEDRATYRADFQRRTTECVMWGTVMRVLMDREAAAETRTAGKAGEA